MKTFSSLRSSHRTSRTSIHCVNPPATGATDIKNRTLLYIVNISNNECCPLSTYNELNIEHSGNVVVWQFFCNIYVCFLKLKL